MFNNFLGIYLCNGTIKPLPSNEQVFLQKCSFEYAVNKSTTSARNATNWTEETNIFKFYKNTSNSIFLAVRGKSVCARVYDIKLYYYYCEERYLKNIKFPKTMSPAEGSKTVEANCSVNSSPSSQTGIQSGFCEHNGKWRIGTNMGCFCEKGFEQKSHKKICARKLVKNIHYLTLLLPCFGGALFLAMSPERRIIKITLTVSLQNITHKKYFSN